MWAGVAQLVEQLICNQLVGGSIPLAGSIPFLVFERGIEESPAIKCDKEEHFKGEWPTRNERRECRAPIPLAGSIPFLVFERGIEESPAIKCDKEEHFKGGNIKYLGRWPSGQWQQTVNLPAFAYEGSNPSLPTIYHENGVCSVLDLYYALMLCS